MDIYKETIDIIKTYYVAESTGNNSELIYKVCALFDKSKNTNITKYQYEFLWNMTNIIGIPQYMELLRRNYPNSLPKIEFISLSNISANINKAYLTVGNNQILHKYQKNVLDAFHNNTENKYILSAPTSFGKTYIVYNIITKMKYSNIVLLFPTISLLSENFENILQNSNYNEYKLHTLSEDATLEDKNIWIFTPERFLSFIDKNPNMHFDFIFIDEIYKIDNEFIIDKETTGENERDIAYRIALEFAYRKTRDILLAGPYMNIISEKNNSFGNFIRDKHFKVINYNDIEIVNKEIININSTKKCLLSGNTIYFSSKSVYDKTYTIAKAITTPEENTIIYNNYKSGTERYAKELMTRMKNDSFTFTCDNPIYLMLIDHLERQFGYEWIVIKALKMGIGIHHGLIPKYIQKEIINLFNEGHLLYLISTTTITEGVNTTAKNIIITSAKKGRKDLRCFDAKNIAGRAGRFLKHFSGRVIVIKNKFEEILSFDEEPLQHKNYDPLKEKTDVDYQITPDKYLTNEDKINKEKIRQEVLSRKIPNNIFSQYKVVSPNEKIVIYDRLLQLTYIEKRQISKLITALNIKAQIDWDGFQTIVDIIYPIIKDQKLKGLIERKCHDDKYSILTAKLHYYLKGGFIGLLDYSKLSMPIDKAMRDTSDMVYNIFKYQLVKYLGVFDIFYKYIKSQLNNIEFEKASGITILLQKLEHNAFSENARIVSDYGVPFKIIQFYDGDNNIVFDDYEKYIKSKVEYIIQEE